MDFTRAEATANIRRAERKIDFNARGGRGATIARL